MAKKNGNSGNSGNNGENGDDKDEKLTPYQDLTAEFVVAVLTGTGLQEVSSVGGEVLVKACSELATQVLALESPEDIDELPEEPTAL